MGTKRHICISIRGVLANWKDSDFKGVFMHDDGREMTPIEAKNSLMDELQKGRRVLPHGEPCEGFDYVKGCPGHDTADEITGERR